MKRINIDKVASKEIPLMYFDMLGMLNGHKVENHPDDCNILSGCKEREAVLNAFTLLCENIAFCCSKLYIT